MLEIFPINSEISSIVRENNRPQTFLGDMTNANTSRQNNTEAFGPIYDSHNNI